MSIMTVVLAAGASSRMGSPKALLDLEGTTYLSRIATTAKAAGSDGVSVVIGPPDGDKVKARLPPGTGSVWNPDPSRGMLSSVQAAVQALPSRTLAMLVWPVDQPLIKAETVRQIMGGSPGKLIVPRYNGKGGHPVRIPRTLFGALAALPPESGLKALLDGNVGAVHYIDVDDANVVADIDTPADHAKAAAADKSTKTKR